MVSRVMKAGQSIIRNQYGYQTGSNMELWLSEYVCFVFEKGRYAIFCAA